MTAANLPDEIQLQDRGRRKSSRRAYLAELLASLTAYGNDQDERAAAVRAELAEFLEPALAGEPAPRTRKARP